MAGGEFCEIENDSKTIQYLFQPTDQPFPSVASSNTSWEKKIRAMLCGQLVDVPLGKPVVSIIGAPFLNNQYAGDYLDFLEVSWQKSFV